MAAEVPSVTTVVNPARKRYPGKGGERSAYRAVPLSELSTPRSGPLDCWLNRYWCVCDEGALFFRGLSPQCNADRRVVERLCPAWARVEFIPVAFQPHHCESY
jgi:hypothetical protein